MIKGYLKVLQEIKDTDYQIGKTQTTLNNLFQDVVIRPSEEQINHATRTLLFRDITEPTNIQCPISQENFILFFTHPKIACLVHNSAEVQGPKRATARQQN